MVIKVMIHGDNKVNTDGTNADGDDNGCSVILRLILVVPFMIMLMMKMVMIHGDTKGCFLMVLTPIIMVLLW